MKNYTINEFWRPRLANVISATQSELPGWYSNVPSFDAFVEAPLVCSNSFGDSDDPENSSVILVSAPGAVGKSTLARQIASCTGGTYLDLAKAEPVGGNTLSGGLVKSDILSSWQNNSATILIDGLDEARLKVSQEGFEAFLGDIAYLSRNRSTPTILFGRTGAVQDAWVVLSGQVSLAVLEIGYYSPEIALNFAKTRFRVAKPDNPHLEAGYRALEALLGSLRQDTQNDGGRFAGYAPVLKVLADSVADTPNPSTLISKVEKGERPVTLQAIVHNILEREHGKIASIAFEDKNLPLILYKPREQLDRLVARVYKRPAPDLPSMNPKDAQVYSVALESWVLDHPFLDGELSAPSPVFEAVITAEALRHSGTSEAASARELAKGAAVNPFIAEFYFDEKQGGYISPSHIGLIYASLRARLSLGDSASLAVEGVEDDDELEQLRADIEISISRFGEEEDRILNFESDQTGLIRLGSHIEDIEIILPYARVEIGGAREAVLVAPVNIQCQNIKFAAERIIVEKSVTMSESAVALEAESADTTTLANVPILNGKVSLSVAWEGAESYPWTAFHRNPTLVQDPRIDEALRRFRKFVISFRSHSKGSLKRYAAKLEHARMTKGTGQAILDYMVLKNILSTDGSMYTLYPEVLVDQTGASYTSVVAHNFSDKTIDFVSKAIARNKQ